MKVSKGCYECLQKLAYHTASLATSDAQVKARVIEGSLKVLEDEFSSDKVSVVIATKIHGVIKNLAQNPDPYREMKDREIAAAKELFTEINPGHEDDFRSYLVLAALGNTIDFFRPLDDIKMDMRGQVSFVVDDSKKFEIRLKDARRVLYLADNAGEVFFDLPLIRWMRQFASVAYVVKAAPVQDDVTLEDVRRAGVEDDLGEIITTGTATPGIDFSVASEQFKREFANADLIFAKGMGYYESLSELAVEGRIFYCLKAKCQPVSDSLGVSLGSYIAMLR